MCLGCRGLNIILQFVQVRTARGWRMMCIANPCGLRGRIFFDGRLFCVRQGIYDAGMMGSPWAALVAPCLDDLAGGVGGHARLILNPQHTPPLPDRNL